MWEYTFYACEIIKTEIILKYFFLSLLFFQDPEPLLLAPLYGQVLKMFPPGFSLLPGSGAASPGSSLRPGFEDVSSWFFSSSRI